MSATSLPGSQSRSAIHPAPARFSPTQIATDPILHFFHYAHLPAALQSASKPFCDLAEHIVTSLPRNPERTVALRKLLEAKDAAVRANLPAGEAVTSPELKDRDTAGVASPPLGEPREVGGHDLDRDGPVPFGA